MSKKQNSLIAGYAIILIGFTLLFFVMPFNRTPAVWTMFVFAEISIVLGWFITNYAVTSGEEIRSKIYGFPILRMSFIYTAEQLLLTLLFGIINLQKETPAWIAAVLSVILLASVLVGTIAADNARDIIETVDNKTERKVQQVKTFKLDIAGLADSCTDSEAKKQLEKLAEKLKYSDPVSSPALENIEGEITQGIEDIKQLVISGGEGLAEKIRAVDMLVDDRNRRCKAEK